MLIFGGFFIVFICFFTQLFNVTVLRTRTGTLRLLSCSFTNLCLPDLDFFLFIFLQLPKTPLSLLAIAIFIFVTMFSCLPQLERAVTEQRWVQPSPSLWAWEFSESHRNVSDLAVTSLKNPFQCGRHLMQVLTVEPQPCSLRQFSTKEHPSACMCMHARTHAHTPASSTCSALLRTVRGTSLNLVSSELYSLRVYSGMQYEEIHTHTHQKVA